MSKRRTRGLSDRPRCVAVSVCRHPLTRVHLQDGPSLSVPGSLAAQESGEKHWKREVIIVLLIYTCVCLFYYSLIIFISPVTIIFPFFHLWPNTRWHILDNLCYPVLLRSMGSPRCHSTSFWQRLRPFHPPFTLPSPPLTLPSPPSSL